MADLEIQKLVCFVDLVVLCLQGKVNVRKIGHVMSKTVPLPAEHTWPIVPFLIMPNGTLSVMQQMGAEFGQQDVGVEKASGLSFSGTGGNGIWSFPAPNDSTLPFSIFSHKACDIPIASLRVDSKHPLF